MKICITGARGFVGTHLVEEFSATQDHDIFSLRWEHGVWKYGKLQPSGGWISQKGPVEVDAVVMAGASTPKRSSEANDLQSALNNIHSVEAFTKINFSKPVKLLYLSSLDVYNFQNVVDEKTSPDPQTLYGHSKLFSEKILGAYSNTFGHALTVLRLGTLFGPGEREYEKVIPSMLKEAKAGLDLHLAGAGSERRSFLFVRDAASVIHEALITPEFPPLVNLVGQEEISILGLAEKISRIPATRVAVVNGPDSYLTVDHQFKKTLMNTISPRPQTPLDEALRIEFESIL